jgi:hypothetical protein
MRMVSVGVAQIVAPNAPVAHGYAVRVKLDKPMVEPGRLDAISAEINRHLERS